MIRSGKPGARRPAATSVRPPVLLIFAITVTGILNNTLIGPSIPDILDDLGRSESGAGFIVAAGSLPGVVVAPIIGLLADRYGRRRVLTPCLLAFAGFGLVAASAPTFEVLVGARLLQGFGTAGLINLAVVLISDHWDGEQRTALIGRNAAVLTLALALAPSIGGVIADLAHWRVALLLYGVGVPAAAAVWRLLPEDRPETSVQVRDQLRDAGVALREPVVLATLGSGVLVFVLIFGGFLTAFPLHLEQEFGLGAAARGALISVPAFSASVVAFNLGHIRRRVALRRLLVFAGCTYVAAFALLAGAGILPVVVVACVVYGLGEGVFIPSLQDAVASSAPPEQRAAVMAVWVGSARLGQTLGPLLAAGALTFTSTGGVFASGTVVAVALLVAQVVGPIGRERLPEPAALPSR